MQNSSEKIDTKASKAEAKETFDLAVVVVNYNTRLHLKRCLVSLKENPFTKGTFRVVVVDNGSKDGSVAMVESEFPWVMLIKNSRNLGFAKGCNQGIKAVRAKYYLLLNSDAAILDDALDVLFEFMEKNPDIGASGGLIYTDDGKIQPSTLIFPKYTNLLFSRSSIFSKIPALKKRMQRLRRVPDFISDVEALAGGFLMLRSEALKQVGLLDERFFIYLEDIDICRRLRKAGWRVVFNPNARILHSWGASSKKRRAKSFFWHHLSMFKYFQKHYPYLLPLNLLLFLGLMTHYVTWFFLYSVSEFSRNGKPADILKFDIKNSSSSEVSDVQDSSGKRVRG